MSFRQPFTTLPLTDFLFLLNPRTKQTNPDTFCAKVERRLGDCYEAYGMGRRGKEKCKDLFHDFNECQYLTFQALRYYVIRRERMKQYREGKLEKPFDEHPPLDGLLYY